MKKSVMMGIGIAVIILAFGAYWFTRGPNYDAFATCLTDHNASMYGAFWCPHCAAQKTVFGDAFKNILYIECSNPDRTQNDVCNEAQIESYPTWQFADGSRLVGEQTVATLGKKAGCTP
jgi:hypothetical protein